jgi:lysophospholipase L1-like esterase
VLFEFRINNGTLCKTPCDTVVKNEYIMRNLSVTSIAIFILACLASNISASDLSVSQRHKENSLNILAIGDSNGALPDGWVTQLKKIRTNDTIFNISISGNTIGFNNNGRKSLNTLANIDDYMDKAYTSLGKIDMVIMMIGTNDCKSVFKDSLSVVPGKMKKLIDEIKLKTRIHKEKPLIFIVSPPPFGPDELVGEKYAGGLGRVRLLNEKLAEIAKDEKIQFIDTFHILLPVFNTLSADGVHLNPDGQMMIARIIQENLKYFSVRR